MNDARERRAAFRAWVRANHPDAGGDPAAFAAGLERRRRARAAEDAPVVVVRRRPGLGPLHRWLERRRRRRDRTVE
ncbi:hypothetical protein [Thermomonospora cellulosilytica]|uniref:Uncharacterized protein n=1 Tax=Thermomonospora cellulosilytica TaxID=1411118 RepID=A0A7W3N4X8_9ACTN|nr:hypothetical protein [Thermomonospora cellulosilytica]MBA9007631.1 hypothetical protein [Thermomonospora cellulosilytica]